MKNPKGTYFDQGNTGFATVINPQQTPLEYLRHEWDRLDATRTAAAQKALEQQREAYELYKDTPEVYQPYSANVNAMMEDVVDYKSYRPSDYRGTAQKMVGVQSYATAANGIETHMKEQHTVLESNPELRSDLLKPVLFSSLYDSNGDIIDPRQIDISQLNGERMAYEMPGGSQFLNEQEVVKNFMAQDNLQAEVYKTTHGATPGGFSSTRQESFQRMFVRGNDGRIRVKSADAIISDGVLSVAETNPGMDRLMRDNADGWIEWGKTQQNPIPIEIVDAQGNKQTMELKDIDPNNPDHSEFYQHLKAMSLKNMMVGRESGEVSFSTAYVKPPSNTTFGAGAPSGSGNILRRLTNLMYLKEGSVTNPQFTTWKMGGNQLVDVTSYVSDLIVSNEQGLFGREKKPVYGLFVDPTQPGVAYVQYEADGTVPPGELPSNLERIDASNIQSLMGKIAEFSTEVKLDDLSEEMTNLGVMDAQGNLDLTALANVNSNDINFRRQLAGQPQQSFTNDQRTALEESRTVLASGASNTAQNDAAIQQLAKGLQGVPLYIGDSINANVMVTRVERDGTYRSSQSVLGATVMVTYSDAQGNTRRVKVKTQALYDAADRGPMRF